MKKKVLYFLGVILISLGLTYGIFYIKRTSAWSSFLTSYSNLEVKGFIHGSVLLEAYTDENELSNLALVENGSVDLDVVKKDNEIANEVIDNMTSQLKKVSKTPKTNIENDETVIYGLVNSDKQDYLYIYSNGTALLKSGESYYVYVISNIDNLNDSYQETIKSITENDPYFQLSEESE